MSKRAQRERTFQELLGELAELKTRINAAMVMEREELFPMAAPILDRLLEHPPDPASLPHTAIPLLLFFFPHSPGPVCKVLSSLRPKAVLALYRAEIGALYRSSPEYCRLFLATDVFGEMLAERVLGDAEKWKAKIKSDAASVAASHSHKALSSVDIIRSEWVEAVRMAAPKVSLQQSLKLAGAIVDLYVLRQSDALLRCLETLVLAAPCRHPLLPVVLRLLACAGCHSTAIDLIVHPRRAPQMKTRAAVADHFVGCSGAADANGPAKTSADSGPVDGAQGGGTDKAAATWSRPLPPQPEPAKRPKTADASDLPEFIMEGPDEE